MILPDRALDPLRRFPVFRTSDPEELRHLGSTLFGAARIDLNNTVDFEARVNLIELQEIGLAFGATTSDLAIDHLETDFIRFQVALKGRATTSANGMMTEINERQFAITPSGVSSRTVCEGGHERLTVRLNQQALSQRLTVLLGVKPKGEMKFEPAINSEHPDTQLLCQLVHFLSQQLDTNADKLPTAVCRELEYAVQTGFLWATRHAFSQALRNQETALAPSMVKRLEGFIEANWQDALTIERLAEEAGTSARAIFRAFKRSRGYSPMAFAKMVRLRRAREILTSGDPQVSVMATAFKCNFGSVGHFAKDYRDAFGELPSQTISAARR